MPITVKAGTDERTSSKYPGIKGYIAKDGIIKGLEERIGIFYLL